jgi:hypothetical protein
MAFGNTREHFRDKGTAAAKLKAAVSPFLSGLVWLRELRIGGEHSPLFGILPVCL